MTGFVPENTKTDLATLFGAGSPPTTDPNAFADYVGVAVHCAAGNVLCSSANGGVADVLPDEPNADGTPAATPGAGYQGYNALYGHKSLTQALNSGDLKDINGNTIVDDFNGTLTPGFPGFSLAPQYSLGYVADMQESGIPVTLAYIITPHRPLPANPYGYGFPSDSRDYGPGEAHYVDQLRQYDAAFGAFFTRLAKDGINKSNTLFVVTSEEGDHFVGGAPSPAGCNGVTLACTYSQTGEVTTDYNGLMQGEQGANLPATSAVAGVTNDDAPDIYLTNNPAPSDPATRAYERATGALTVTSPISHNMDQLTQEMANPAEFNILHMLTADPLRTPTFTAFANPDYYVQGQAVPGCAGSATPSSACVVETPGFAWNHGDVQPQITTTWVGFVGPGVLARHLDGPDPTAEAQGVRFGTFSDHTDIRPTMLQLLGLHDDYASDGRALVEDMANSALPPALHSGSPGRAAYIQLAQLYKQLNAPVGAFGLATLKLSTQALESRSPGDTAYNNLEQLLVALGLGRDTIAAGLLKGLESAFGPQPQPLASIQPAARLSSPAQRLLGQVSTMTRQ
jgi:arylsulfatase A-like enzyme